ncbi:MAG: F0F1 ATP synthase subunit A [Acidobacteriota bacterium]
MEHHNAFWTDVLHAAGYHVPDALFMATVVALVLITIGLIAKKKLSAPDAVENPGRFQQFLEILIGGFADFTESIIHHEGRRYVPVILTFGLFIFTSNFFGLIPTLGSPTTSYACTLALGICSFVYYNFSCIKAVGLGAHLKHLCGPMLLLAPLMFPIELIGNFARIASLSLRLFGNLNGEHAASGIFYGFLGGFLAPLPIMALGLLGVCLQTFIFVLLSMLYIALVVDDH